MSEPAATKRRRTWVGNKSLPASWPLVAWKGEGVHHGSLGGDRDNWQIRMAGRPGLGSGSSGVWRLASRPARPPSLPRAGWWSLSSLCSRR